MKKIIKQDELKFHFIFLFILSLNYLIPLLLVGQLIVDVHDLLEVEIPFNHVIGNFYRGEEDSINLLLAGEVKWFNLRRVLQPLTLFYAFLNTELAFWTIDIIVKLSCYIFFFKLARKLKYLPFYSALISCLYASLTIPIHWDLGLACFPYLIYLTIKNKELKLKHYIIILFIGLNTDLVRYSSIIPTLFILSMIFFPKGKKYNYKIFFQISSVLFFFMLLSNSNLIYTQIATLDPTHRVDRVFYPIDLKNIFIGLLASFFSLPNIFENPYFFRSIPIWLATFTGIIISLFSKSKQSYLLLLTIFFIHLTYYLPKLEFIVAILNNSDGFLKTFNFSVIFPFVLPLVYTLLFLAIPFVIVNKLKYFIFTILIFSVLSAQTTLAIIPLGKYFLSFESLNIKQKNQLRKSFHDQNYINLIKDYKIFRSISKSEKNESFKSKYTFVGYYDYKNYKYIKSIIGQSRTISVGLDPMVAVMNNIKVIDGYYDIYPLSYKIKFRKIIQEQLNYYKEMKKYYDDWGNRVYTFVSDPNIIKINFAEAKLLGAEYVISKYPISNQILELICGNCNNSTDLFLYKITNQ